MEIYPGRISAISGRSLKGGSMSELSAFCEKFQSATATELVRAFDSFGILTIASGESITLSLPEARELIGLLEDYYMQVEENH